MTSMRPPAAGSSSGRRIGDGVRWDLLDQFDGWATDLAVDFSASPRKFYAGVAYGSQAYASGIWKHDDQGWRRCDSGIDTSFSRTIALALAAIQPAVLYAKVERRDGQLLGVYKTETAAERAGGGGDAWAELPVGTMTLNDCRYHWYNSVLEVDPSDAKTVYGGGLNLCRTTDGGQQWEPISAGE